MFYSILTFLYFYMITNFDSHYHHGYYDFFASIVFVIVIAIIISSFSIGFDMAKHCSKLAIKPGH